MVVRKLLSVEEWAGLVRSCKSVSQLRSVHALITARHTLFKGNAGIYLSNVLIQMYGRYGSIDDAIQVFDSIALKNSYSWTMMLAACVHNQRFVEATLIFRKMPDPDIVSGAVMIGVFSRRGMADEAKRTFDRVPKNVVSWNTLVAVYAQKRHLEEMEILAERMPMHDAVTWATMIAAYNQLGLAATAKAMFDSVPERSPQSWTSMLVSIAQSGDLDQAKTMFDEMPGRDVVAWTALLAASAHAAHLRHAKALFDRIPMRDMAVWAAMLVSYGRHGLVNAARDLFLEMPSQDEYTVNAMLAAYAQNGQVPQAKAMFDCGMPRRDVVAWNALFAAYAQARDTRGALSMFQRMPMWDVLTWNTMLAAHAREGDVGVVGGFFAGMPAQDILAWNTLLGAYGDSGHFSLALQAFQLMAHHGVRPDDVTFLCLLLGCNHGGTVATARCLFLDMVRDHGIPPIKLHYSCLVDALGRSGHLEDAEELIASMPFMPDDVDWHCLLAACKIHSDRERATRAARHAVEIGESDPAHYVLFASMLRTKQHVTLDCD
ncbi:pentatricopeptide repeat-containing protein At2g35030, mitochondrial-like [Selaginella moellendorffii]|uniref:pentatricopeptide repeat-containing protein At2g35030, mitochondrial-like n=1 Tax=Selaginella moellendorffii TaxID=88036 RepID=UPI000D1D0C74|nr:pentatricopeptide repeat-containing protein At2g35030, mitochondrial-like [Selaginella moellendorffii]|eukprot:XP_024521303.1 pentatricopeptide repeat-containing protein At2g35030, mitochondrial-like [Selaginella moellendorffii]